MKTTWAVVSALIDESGQQYYQRNDADNLSYRVSVTVDGVKYECSVMKLPVGNADLVDFETNYLASAIAGA